MNHQQKQQENLNIIRKLRLIDDDFMTACFEGNTEAAELLLKVILEKSDFSVKAIKTQNVLKNLNGHDVWLDIDAIDYDGNKYNIEIQRSDKGADRKRARYHSSILDAHLLKSGHDFCDLPETYVIFITENDVLKKGKPLYRIERQIIGEKELFNDGEHIVYVNGSIRNETTKLGRLMHDFFCVNPDEMFYNELAQKVRYFKENPKGVKTMCKLLEDMKKQAAKQAAKQTEERIKTENALNLLKIGKLSIEEIAISIGLTIEKVSKLAKQI